ncbi:extracellular solute-binding protein [Paenibacillus harenae]|uniref:extracellular solute-binding protein n=1 Tax=Paenibacillus harenae TaxID=306543 RepID=UPI0004008E55|nr:extracellular solute-binding protein [Paenibacillus harenae]
MNKHLKLLQTVLAILLTISLLAACGGNNGTSNNGNDTNSTTDSGTSATNEPREIIDIEMVMSTWGTLRPENDFIADKLKEELGINLTITDEVELMEKLNVRAAGSNLPDLMMFGSANDFRDYAKRGLLTDFTPHLEKLDQVQAFLGQGGFDKATVEGKVYGVAKEPTLRAFSYWIRQDWLDNLGLSMPTTLDEFYEVMVAFTEDDPDGNNKNDTYGLTGSFGGLGAFTPILATLGAAPEYQIRDGELVNFYSDPQLKESLTYIKKLADAKVLDPELTTNSGQRMLEKSFQGMTGAIYSTWADMVKDDRVEVWKTANPDAEWAIVPPFQDHVYGEAVDFKDAGATSGFVAISKAAGSNEEKLNRILELFNYISHDEGLRMVQFGLEGEHYNLDGDKVTPTDKASEAAYSWIYQFMGRPEMSYLSTKFANQADWIERAADLPRITTYNGFVTKLQEVNYADRTRFIEEEFLKFVYDKRDINEFDQFVKELKDTFMLDKEIEHAKQILTELGYLKKM